MPILKAVKKPQRKSGLSTVVLHGRLQEFAPDPMPLKVSTVAGVIRAMCALRPGFEAAMREGHYRLIRGEIDSGIDLDETMLRMNVSGTTLHILPVAEGAKNGAGVGKVVLGAVVVIGSILTYGAAAEGLFGADAAAGIAGSGAIGVSTAGIATGLGTIGFGQLALFGAGILLGGISTILSPQPRKNTGLTNNSYGLSGRLNTTTEGGPVPIIYGQVMVGSTVVSVGYSNEDLLTNLQAIQDNNLGSGGSGTSGSYTGAGGSGGKGSGSSGASTQANNTLQSDSIIRIIDVWGEGQVNLVNGAQSIFFNNTPLQADDGTYNFQGVNWEVRIGLPDQDPVDGYPAAEQTFAGAPFPIQVFNADPPVVQQVTSETADRASVTLEIPALYTIDSTNGFIGAGPDLSYMVEVQAVDGAWSTVVDTTISGQKNTAPYQVTYSFALPGAGSGTTVWNLRVTRLTADNTNSNIADDLYWVGYSLITDHQLIYPNTAYIALTLDAQSFGSSIPTRLYLVERLDVQVPENFDPVSGTYATSGAGTSGGTWDGVSWKPAVTSDPCWCLYDLLTNSTYGVGLPSSVTEATAYDLYTISQYCNGTVPDGFGGTETRYTLNVIIATQADAYSVIQNMASAFRGMTYWGSGSVVVTADMPADPVALVTQANVVNGEFNYEGTGLNTRHNMVRVTWTDPSNYYQPAVEVAEDAPNVALRGIVPTDIVAFGCISRGLANRLGRWLLYTEQYQTQTLTHVASYDQISVRPGQVFAQSDPYYAGARMAGRVRSGASQAIIPLDANIGVSGFDVQNYSLCVQMPDGTVQTEVPVQDFQDATDSNGNSYTIVILGSELPSAPDPDAVYIIISASIFPQQWTCLGMTEPDPGVYQIVSLNYNPSKFAYVEDGVNLSNQQFSILPSLLLAPLPPPNNVTVNDYFQTLGTTTTIVVTISWTSPGDPRVTGYEISANSSANFAADYTTTSVTYNISNIPAGTYVFGVRSLGAANQTSTWVYTAQTTINGTSIAPSAPTGLTAIGGTRRIQLNWDPVPQTDILYYEVWRSTEVVFSPPSNGATLLLQIAATSYTDNDSANLLPNTTWYYWVRAVSTTLAEGAFAGPAGAETTDLVADSIADGIVNTASFAQGLTPVVLIPNIATQNGTYDGEIAYDETSQALYRWSAASSSWSQILNATTQGWFDSITAGIGTFGGLKSAQIAAGAIEATNLASETLITQSAQIGSLVVGTTNIQTNAATETYVAEATNLVQSEPDAPLTGEYNSIAVSVPDGSTAVVLYIRLSLGSSEASSALYTGGGGGGGGDGGGGL